MKKILTALEGKSNDIPPIWLMRQAGRFLPEYRELRANLGSFLDLCYSSENASEVTLQPVRRFDLDAAILFSDILVIPDALGMDLKFVQNEGPKLNPIKNIDDINKLNLNDVVKYLEPVFQTIKNTVPNLPSHTAMIGFAGSPWTVSTYMIEGGGSKDFMKTKIFSLEKPKEYQKLQEILIQATAQYLIEQVKSGVEVLQLFDSWSGVLSETEFNKNVIKPTQKIIEIVRKSYPNIPIIGFPKGAGILYQNYISQVDVQGVSIDYTVPVKWAAQFIQPHMCVQGNLDPLVLASGSNDNIVTETNKILDALGNGAFIFNLGHGIVPHTPIENVELVIKTIRG